MYKNFKKIALLLSDKKKEEIKGKKKKERKRKKKKERKQKKKENEKKSKEKYEKNEKMPKIVLKPKFCLHGYR